MKKPITLQDLIPTWFVREALTPRQKAKQMDPNKFPPSTFIGALAETRREEKGLRLEIGHSPHTSKIFVDGKDVTQSVHVKSIAIKIDAAEQKRSLAVLEVYPDKIDATPGEVRTQRVPWETVANLDKGETSGPQSSVFDQQVETLATRYEAETGVAKGSIQREALKSELRQLIVEATSAYNYKPS